MGAVVDFEFAGLRSGRATAGHRFLAPASFDVADFADYRKKLTAARVLLDPAERRQAILDGAGKLAEDAALTLIEDDGLLDELTGLVEWPVPLMGTIDARFMAVPAEVLVTTMKVNQKYLSLRDGGGNLAPHFITIANMETADGGQAILGGNQYVLTARLADAEFFWELDRKTELAARVPALDEVVFHAKLGSLGGKVRRLVKLAGAVAKELRDADQDQAERAALLAKADLTSEMVGEFANLQGVMGRYYAQNDGEPAAVAQAIAEHYAPQGPRDACPTAPVSIAVALADKLDILAGFWLIDEKPTGSKDPFALRRAALGIIRLVLENQLRLPLKAAFDGAFENYELPRPDGVGDDLLGFFADRLKVHLRAEGVRHDLISAVFARGDEDDLLRLMARVAALAQFIETEEGENLLTAYRRAANILRIEEKKDKTGYDGAIDPTRFTTGEESTLDQALSTAAERADEKLAAEDFAGAMAALSALRDPVDAFFEKVTVNTDDSGVRVNRLHLLSKIRDTLHRVADFSHIEG